LAGGTLNRLARIERIILHRSWVTGLNNLNLKGAAPMLGSFLPSLGRLTQPSLLGARSHRLHLIRSDWAWLREEREGVERSAGNGCGRSAPGTI